MNEKFRNSLTFNVSSPKLCDCILWLQCWCLIYLLMTALCKDSMSLWTQWFWLMLGPFTKILNWTEPMTFRPEKFQKEGEAHKLIPFGLGRRTCPGARLAYHTMGLTLGLLIQIFDWKWVSKEAVEMTEGKRITTSKVIPLEALCKSRLIINKLHSPSYWRHFLELISLYVEFDKA